MKLVTGTALLVAIALGTTACGSSHGVSAQKAHLHFPSNVPTSLASFIRTTVKSSDGTVSGVAVYGPGSRRALVKATSGDGIGNAEPQGNGYYLVVLNGSFGCPSCSRPPGAKQPRGTVETYVVSAKGHNTDYGIGDSAGPGVAHLRRSATVAVS